MSAPLFAVKRLVGGDGEPVGLALRAGERAALLVSTPDARTALTDQLLALGGRRARRRGGVQFHGEELGRLRAARRRSLREHLALLPARCWLALDPGVRIGEQLADAFQAHHRVSRQAALDRAIDTLELVGLPAPQRLTRARPGQLPEAELACTALALALVNHPYLLVAEDPFSGLDRDLELQLLDLLGGLQRRFRFSLVLITTDPALAQRIAAGSVTALDQSSAI
jgi:peptide/nickel transport system ATP-binding protein